MSDSSSSNHAELEKIVSSLSDLKIADPIDPTLFKEALHAYLHVDRKYGLVLALSVFIENGYYPPPDLLRQTTEKLLSENDLNKEFGKKPMGSGMKTTVAKHVEGVLRDSVIATMHGLIKTYSITIEQAAELVATSSLSIGNNYKPESLIDTYSRKKELRSEFDELTRESNSPPDLSIFDESLLLQFKIKPV